MKGKLEGLSVCGVERFFKIFGILCVIFSYDFLVMDIVMKYLVCDNFVVFGGLELIND